MIFQKHLFRCTVTHTHFYHLEIINLQQKNNNDYTMIAPHHSLVDSVLRYGGRGSGFDPRYFRAAPGGIKLQQLAYLEPGFKENRLSLIFRLNR